MISRWSSPIPLMMVSPVSASSRTRKVGSSSTILPSEKSSRSFSALVSGSTDTYTVVNHSSGKCLDVAGISTANGAAVQQWTCHGGTNQRFRLAAATALGNSHDYQLVAVHSGKCVDVSTISTAPGALVHQWPCDTGSTLTTKKNQIWRLTGKD